MRRPWYCPESHTTFSLLQDCLAARLPGTLAELEHAVVTAERFQSVAAAAALATLDLYLELGAWNQLKRLYVEHVLTEAKYIGRASNLGLTVHALSRDGEWCGRHVVFRMTRSESRDMYSKNDPEFYMRQFGKRIHEGQFCPEARSAEVYGYSETGGDLLFRGTSSSAVGWNEWNWESL